MSSERFVKDGLSLEADLESDAISNWNRIKIRKLELEIENLNSVLESGSEDSEDFCAHIEGEFTDFKIIVGQKETAIGRGENVDIDLTNEISSSRVHRRHCVLKESVIKAY
jgi:hypothetical protein